jgi:glycosyltransferase involved in cell wall biosynthesis
LSGVSGELISIVLPVHNQAGHIGQRMQSYLEVLADLDRPVELILVTNACSDTSPGVCRELALRDGRVIAVDSQRGGWGLAVKLGLQTARGELLAYTNTARTDGATLRQALDLAMARPDSVVKVRRQSRGLWRGLGSTLYNWECRLLFGLHWGDVNGTPKFFPRRFSRLLALRRDDDLIDAEFSMLCRRHGYPVIELPVRWGERSGGKSTTKISSAIKMYVGAYQLAKASRLEGT